MESECMDNKLIKVVLFLALIAGMTGIAVAEPCPAYGPGATGKMSSSTVTPYALDGALNQRLYYLTTTVTFKEYCVYPNNNATSLPGATASNIITGWDMNIQNNNQVIFRNAGQGGVESYGPGNDIHIGDVQYSADPTPELLILIHIKDTAECEKLYPTGDPEGTNDNGVKTCFVQPKKPNGNGEIPEFPTVALPVAAVIGLLFFFTKRNSKKE